MADNPSVSFDEALDLVESLPPDQRAQLIDIVQRRLIEARRQEIANSANEARNALSRVEVRRGSVDDLLEELDS